MNTPWTKEAAEEVENLAAQAPTAVEIHRKEEERRKFEADKIRDQQLRILCIENATRACSAGGYEPNDIMKVVQGYYSFLTERGDRP